MKKSTMFALFFLSDLVAVGLFIFALAQVQETGDLFSKPIVFVALGLFILVPVILLIVYSQSSSTASDAELLRTGTPAYATVEEVWDMRPITTNGVGQIGLKLQINPDNDTSYETKITAAVSALNPAPYHAGMVLKVRYNPRHPKRVVIDDGSASAAPDAVAAGPTSVKTTFTTNVKVQLPQGMEGLSGVQGLQGDPANPTSFQINTSDISKLPPALQNLIQSALVDADHNGIPDIMEKGGTNGGNVQVVDLSGRIGGPVDPQARIAKLEKLRAAGIINQEMFDALKSKIENASHTDVNQ